MNTGSYQPPSRWQRVCRRLWRVTAIFWGVIIAGTTINTIANIFATSTDLPLSRLYVIYWIMTYRVPLFFVMVGLLALTIIFWIGSRTRKGTPSSPINQQNSVNIPLAGNDEDTPTFGSPKWFDQQLNREFDRMDD